MLSPNEAQLLLLATAAAQQQDWAAVNQCLQQLLIADSSDGVDRTAVEHPESWLALALQVLQNGEFQHKWEVVKLLPLLGEIALHPLIDLAQDELMNPTTRWFAIRLLGSFNHPAVMTALITLINTVDDEDLEAMAVESLTQQGVATIPALIPLLADPTNRLSAVQALAQIRHTQTISPLLQVVTDPDPQVRSLALEALSSFREPQIAPVLVAALQDPVATVRQVAVTGLGLRSDLATELGLAKHLADRLWDLNLDVCRQAAIALGRLGGTEAIIALEQVARSPHTPIPLAVEAIRALAWIGQTDALESLHRLLMTDLRTEVALEIFSVLGRVAPPLQARATQILLERLQTGHPLVQSTTAQQAIVLSLGQLGDRQAIEPLIQLLPQADTPLRLHIIAGLKALDRKAAYDRLIQLVQEADSNPELVQGFEFALQEW